jgi:hypothetical protein
MHRASGSTINIDRNGDGVPLFPRLALKEMTPGSVAKVMSTYLDLLWGTYTSQRLMFDLVDSFARISDRRGCQDFAMG